MCIVGHVGNIARDPCANSAFLWGIGLGSGLFCHFYWRFRSPQKAIDGFMYGFFPIVIGKYGYCRYTAQLKTRYYERMKMSQAFEQQQERLNKDNLKYSQQEKQE
jgi:hypothetical protein